MVELLVAVTVILVVLAVAGASYLKMVRSFKVQSSLPETHLSTLCGLELLRYDVEMAGYGLPHQVSPVTYNEAVASSSYTPSPDTFNDAPGNPPKALDISDNGNDSAGNSDVLVIKSARANINQTSSRWNLLFNTGGTWRFKQWNSTEMDLANGDRFLMLNTDRDLQSQSGTWSFIFNSTYYSSANTTLLPVPSSTSDFYLAYGIDPDTNLRMPFNRVDYYLRRPSTNFPSRCDSGSYILYRATINQGDGKRNPQPILDCVRDFQVAFGVDTNGDGVVDSWRSDLNLTDSNSNGRADEIRSQVREVRIFILIQEGVRDEDYSFVGTLSLGDTNTTILSTYTPVGDARHYRWKVLQVDVKPMNLR